MCQLCLSQLNCWAFKANELWSDYKGLNYSIHRLWIMQRSRCDRVSAHRMRNSTQVLNAARGWRGPVCVTGLNSSLTCLHMRARTRVFFRRRRHAAHAKRGNWERGPGGGRVYPLALVYGSSGVKRAGGFTSICCWWEWSGVECSETTTHKHARHSHGHVWTRRLPLRVRKYNYAARAVDFESRVRERIRGMGGRHMHRHWTCVKRFHLRIFVVCHRRHIASAVWCSSKSDKVMRGGKAQMSVK